MNEAMFKKIFGKKLQAKSSKYKLLLNSDVDWVSYKKNIPSKNSDPVDFFIQNYKDYPVIIRNEFDSAYYLDQNPDVRFSESDPLEHYLMYGRAEGRPSYSVTSSAALSNGKLLEQHEIEVKVEHLEIKNFIENCGFALDAFAKEKSISINEAIEWIVSESSQKRLHLPGFFDQKLYENIYLDLRKAQINLFEHFINHGFKEGRCGWIQVDDHLFTGGMDYDYYKSTIIVVAHESAASGAPVVALELAKRLNAHYNVITVSLKDGVLRDQFVESGFLFFDAPIKYGIGAIQFVLEHIKSNYYIKSVLLSSVETMDFLDAAVAVGLPTVSLLHEFAEYTLPRGKMSRTLYTADIVIYPAKTLMNSGLLELKETTATRIVPYHIRIKPQGYLGFQNCPKNDEDSLRVKLGIDEEAIVIAGAGHVQARKGLDWFFETCVYLKQFLEQEGDVRAEKLKFVWLGSGYSENDTLVSVWIETFLKKRGIRSDCYFPGSVNNVKSALADADLFLLTSKLDPFPNVCIDALSADTSVALFEGASGVADFVREKQARHVSATYGDCYLLAQNIADNLGELLKKDGINTNVCNKHLNFDDYISYIRDSMSEAEESQTEIQKTISRNVAFKEKFDPEFYGLSFSDNNPAHHFLSLLYRGFVFSKPFPGSDILTAYHKNRFNSKKASFDDYVTDLMLKSTDNYPVTMLSGKGKSSKSWRIALQLHVYYPDLIAEYCAYFKVLKDHQVDLFVSHIQDLSEEHLEYLDSSVSGKVVCEKFENAGRNVYPFNRLLADHIRGQYELVAHFHTKKSNDNESGVGDRWRKYLLGNLLGSVSAANQILGMFDDDHVGMVFAEDAHSTDEGENRPFIEAMLKLLELEAKDAYHIFPVGTMFWARTDALALLDQLPEDYFKLSEPVPYDGSTLHAFERLLPQLVEAQGYSVKRVYTKNTRW
jgi:hypothetical protein